MTALLALGLLTTCPFLLGAPADARAQGSRPSEPVVGQPCEGCQAVFVGLPQPLSVIPAHTRLGPSSEEGLPIAGQDGQSDSVPQDLRIEGTVRDQDGRLVPGVIVYAYHTDERGIYPRDEAFAGTPAFRHGALRGWARTDADGRYTFDTIRPAGYPGTSIPEHVHMHVLEPGRCTYYIADILFEDDPRLTEAQRRNLASSRGGNGVCKPVRAEDGRWLVRRDIVLGLNVPEYPER